MKKNYSLFILFSYIFIIWLSLFINFSVSALTLEEALSSAYENNDDMRNNRAAFNEELEKMPQAISSFLPSVNAQFSLSEQKQKDQTTNQVGRGEATSQTLSVSQPIFSGFSSIAFLNSARLSFKAAKFSLQAREQDFFLQAIKIFLNVIEAEEKLKIAKMYFNANKKHLEATEIRLKIGEATISELEISKAYFAISESSVLESSAMLDAIKEEFYKFFGIASENLITPAPVEVELPDTVEEFIEKTLNSNSLVFASRYNLQVAKSQIQVSRSGLLPRADFNMSFSKLNNTGLSSIDDKYNSSKSFATRAEIQVVVPIYPKGGAEYSNIRIAKNQYARKMIDLDKNIKQNKVSSISAWQSFHMNKSKLNSTRKALEAYKIAYDGILKEQQIGTKSILDVLEVEDKLNKSRISYITANKDYLLSIYQLKALMGFLNAKDLGLNVEYFDPDLEFKKNRFKIIGSF